MADAEDPVIVEWGFSDFLFFFLLAVIVLKILYKVLFGPTPGAPRRVEGVGGKRD